MKATWSTGRGVKGGKTMPKTALHSTMIQTPCDDFKGDQIVQFEKHTHVADYDGATNC